MSRERPVVTDTGPLIHLAEATSLSLLDRFDALLVPEVVFEELQAGGVPAAFGSLDHERRRIDVAADRYPELDPGETAALALSDRVDGMLLTDDMEARQRANDAGVEVHGSIGIVFLAHADGHLDAAEAKDRIRALERESTLYLSKPLITRAIERIDSRGSERRDG